MEVRDELAGLRHLDVACRVILYDLAHPIMGDLFLDVVQSLATPADIVLVDHRAANGLDELDLHVADMGDGDPELEWTFRRACRRP